MNKRKVKKKSNTTKDSAKSISGNQTPFVKRQKISKINNCSLQSIDKTKSLKFSQQTMNVNKSQPKGGKTTSLNMRIRDKIDSYQDCDSIKQLNANSTINEGVKIKLGIIYHNKKIKKTFSQINSVCSLVDNQKRIKSHDNRSEFTFNPEEVENSIIGLLNPQKNELLNSSIVKKQMTPIDHKSNKNRNIDESPSKFQVFMMNEDLISLNRIKMSEKHDKTKADKNTSFNSYKSKLAHLIDKTVTRFDYKKINDNPGPGSYNIELNSDKKKSKLGKINPKSAHKIDSTDIFIRNDISIQLSKIRKSTPGPGNYYTGEFNNSSPNIAHIDPIPSNFNPLNNPLLEERDKYKLRPNNDDFPGPCHYKPILNSIVKKVTLGQIIPISKSKSRIKDKDDDLSEQVGPGKYNIIDSQTINKIPLGYIGPEEKEKITELTPGPGQYELEYSLIDPKIKLSQILPLSNTVSKAKIDEEEILVKEHTFYDINHETLGASKFKTNLGIINPVHSNQSSLTKNKFIITPGPGRYEPFHDSQIGNVGKNAQNSGKLGIIHPPQNLASVENKTLNVGPGSYNPKLIQSRQLYGFINPLGIEQEDEITVGPGEYDPKPTMNRLILGYITNEGKNKEIQVTPGPGAFTDGLANADKLTINRITFGYIDEKISKEKEKFITPGPGSYKLDTGSSYIKNIILGFINPEGKKKEVTVTPGPGEYDDLLTCQNSSLKRVTQGVIYPLSQKLNNSTNDSENIPGPGFYDVKTYLSSKLGHMDPIHKESKELITPGSGEYDVKVSCLSQIKNTLLGYINPESKLKQIEVTPGPGHFNPYPIFFSDSKLNKPILGHIDPIGSRFYYKIQKNKSPSGLLGKKIDSNFHDSLELSSDFQAILVVQSEIKKILISFIDSDDKKRIVDTFPLPGNYEGFFNQKGIVDRAILTNKIDDSSSDNIFEIKIGQAEEISIDKLIPDSKIIKLVIKFSGSNGLAREIEVAPCQEIFKEFLKSKGAFVEKIILLNKTLNGKQEVIEISPEFGGLFKGVENQEIKSSVEDKGFNKNNKQMIIFDNKLFQDNEISKKIEYMGEIKTSKIVKKDLLSSFSNGSEKNMKSSGNKQKMNKNSQKKKKNKSIYYLSSGKKSHNQTPSLCKEKSIDNSHVSVFISPNSMMTEMETPGSNNTKFKASPNNDTNNHQKFENIEIKNPELIEMSQSESEGLQNQISIQNQNQGRRTRNERKLK